MIVDAGTALALEVVEIAAHRGGVRRVYPVEWRQVAVVVKKRDLLFGQHLGHGVSSLLWHPKILTKDGQTQVFSGGGTK